MATLTCNINPVTTSARMTFTVYSGKVPSILTPVSFISRGGTSNDTRFQGLIATSISCVFVSNLIAPSVPVAITSDIRILKAILLYCNNIDPIKTSISVDVVLFPTARNRFWTSTIGGEVSFDMVEENPEVTDNVVPFEGWLYRGLKLGGSVVIYGENGVLRAMPSETEWGQVQLHEVGLKGKNAVCGDENTHYFIDQQGYFGIVTEKGLQIIDYKQFFSVLSKKTVMFLDPRNKWVHIADGNIGFTYSPFGLGAGFYNITGMGLQSGNFYLSSDFRGRVFPALHIKTDILDFGSRGQKTISLIEVATDVISNMKVAVNYKKKSDTTFRQTAWYPLMAGGVAYPLVTGVEFQVEVKQVTYMPTTIDRIGIRGKYWS